MTRTRDASTADDDAPTAATETADDESAEPTPDEALDVGGPVDPARLVADPDIDDAERVYPHTDTDHCEADAAARAVVGVTRDDGAVLLLVNRSEDHAILPHPTVESMDDLVAVAREETADLADVPVEIGAPVAVRRVEHYAVDDPDVLDDAAAFEPPADASPHNVTHHVVLEASVASDGDAHGRAPTLDDPDWEAGWFHELPVEMDEEAGDVLDDIRRFLD